MEKPVVLSLDEECLLVDEGGGHEGEQVPRPLHPSSQQSRSLAIQIKVYW